MRSSLAWYNRTMMDKYNLTQEQWDEMVIAQLKATEKALDAGTVELIPNKEAHAQIMRHIAELAEKEHAKTALSFQASHLYEPDGVTTI